MTPHASPLPLRLAIITVTREDLPGLHKTWRSLRAQTRQDFAWVVVDGGGTPDTARWLAGTGHRATWWRSSPDQGLYDAMNRGLEAAWGLGADWVWFLNSGDALAGADTLAVVMAAMDRVPEAGFLYGGAWEEENGGPLRDKPARSHLWARMGMFTHHQAMLFHRRAAAGLAFDLRWPVGADYAFTLQVLARKPRVVALPQRLCVFAAGGLSGRCAGQGRQDQDEIRQHILAMGPWLRRIIRARHVVAMALRRGLPDLFWRYRAVAAGRASGAMGQRTRSPLGPPTPDLATWEKGTPTLAAAQPTTSYPNPR